MTIVRKPPTTPATAATAATTATPKVVRKIVAKKSPEEPAVVATEVVTATSVTTEQPRKIIAHRVGAAATIEGPQNPSASAVSSDNWAHTGQEGEALAAAEVARREQDRSERAARGYWPRTFELIPPSIDYPDRYQADVLLLDEAFLLRFYLHTLANTRTGRFDVFEPCPKEFDNCPICPPAGKYESVFVGPLSVLNLNGYTYARGERAGEHVPISQQLMLVRANEQIYFDELRKEHGSLRGIQLTMTRPSKHAPYIGEPTFVGKFSEEDIIAFVKDSGMWTDKITKEQEKIADAGWIIQPFDYTTFIHKPSAADLRARFSGVAPIGARGAASSEWGHSRYAPGARAAPGAALPSFDDLSDDVPF